MAGLPGPAHAPAAQFDGKNPQLCASPSAIDTPRIGHVRPQCEGGPAASGKGGAQPATPVSTGAVILPSTAENVSRHNKNGKRQQNDGFTACARKKYPRIPREPPAARRPPPPPPPGAARMQSA